MTKARYIIYGAGGVGASLGAQLHQAGREVILIARGPHLEAIRARGLVYRTPRGVETLSIEAVDHPRSIEFHTGDRVLLAMKSQDTAAALGELRAIAPIDLPILCAQNGVHNERLAMRSFRRVYGLAVWIPASFEDPGVVSNYAPAAPIELGRIPEGADPVGRAVVEDLVDAGFDAALRDRVLDWKYAKLLMNIQTTIDAVCGSRVGLEDVCREIRAEAEACYAAAGIFVVEHDAHVERLRAAALAMGEIDGAARSGGSSTQSLKRGLGSIETDYINGEIVLLGRLHGVPTPANEALQRTANRLAGEGEGFTPLSADALRTEIARAAGDG